MWQEICSGALWSCSEDLCCPEGKAWTVGCASCMSRICETAAPRGFMGVPLFPPAVCRGNMKKPRNTWLSRGQELRLGKVTGVCWELSSSRSVLAELGLSAFPQLFLQPRLQGRRGWRRSHPPAGETAGARVETGAVREMGQINMSLKARKEFAGIPDSAVIAGKCCSWQTFIQWLFNSSWLTAGLPCNPSHSLPPPAHHCREFPLLRTAREKGYNCSFWKFHLNQGSRINITSPRIC